ncbi:MAG: FAD-dependent oxidoreductase [Elusimicrobiota bacterium]
MYDLIIVGGGPAGITASIYAARKKINFIVITKEVGGQTNWTLNVENYTGFRLVTGAELVKQFRDHLKQYNITAKEGEEVVSLEKNGDTVKVVTNKGEYSAKTAIIASGKIPRRLGVDGENRLRNKGLAYCATCDAPMFADMDVAVIGGGNSALDAALQLVNIAKKVYIIDNAPGFTADQVMVEKALSSPIVTAYHDTTVTMISGEKFVNGIGINHGGKEELLNVEGIFVEIGSVPATDFVKGVEKNEHNEIWVNCKTETNIPGIFAAGDATSVPAKQIIVASGEGAKAAISAFEYINKLK